MADYDHDDAEAMPDCTEQDACNRMTDEDRARRCACRGLRQPRTPYDLSPGDVRFLRSLRVDPEVT